MKHLTPALLLALVLAITLVPTLVSADTLTGHTADGEFWNEPIGDNEKFATTGIRVGFPGTKNSSVIFVFDLDSVTDSTFDSASLSFTLKDEDGDPTWDVDLYGMGFSATATDPTVPDTLGTRYSGPSGSEADPNTTLLANSVIVGQAGPTPTGEISTGNLASLVSFLNTRPDDASGRYVWLRLSATVPSETANDIFYTVYSADNATPSTWPTLTFTTVAIKPGTVIGIK